MTLALGTFGGSEILIILVVVLVLFGGSQLPKLARSIGEAQKEFKKGLDGALGDEEILVTACVNDRGDVPEAIKAFLGKGR